VEIVYVKKYMIGSIIAVIAYFCWSYVLSILDTSKATVYLFLVPIVTLLIGYLWLEEIPSLLAIIGGLITILGVEIDKYRKIVFDNYLENVYKN